MSVETTKKLFSVDEYYRMAEAGIFAPEDRVELIDGEVLQMTAVGVRHVTCVNIATELFAAAFRGRAIVSVQNPLQLNNYTEPEPDMVLLKPRKDRYHNKKLDAECALLVVEISDSTFAYDRNVKLPRYAASGIPEVWIENLPANELFIFRNPVADRYAQSLVLGSGDIVTVQAFPDAPFKVEELLAVPEVLDDAE